MKELFIAGGALFMGILTLLFLALLVWNVFHLIVHFKSENKSGVWLLERFKIGKDIGLFALIFGALGQMVGLFTAFSVIQELETVKSSVLAGGLKVSMIPTLYGMMIFLLSLLFYFIALVVLNNKEGR